ncbi:undecaprenyl-diphosphate phosphatase [Patescibacteria group bacterium]|nr:undecaprenyl-diphosphate phosphatase [Patescibacteria group bacterium]
MFESIILGSVQGIAEWLPISSEAMIVLVKTNFFPSGMPFSELISFAIFLHTGTLLAVIVYYRKKIIALFRQCLHYQSLGQSEKQYIHFIVVATAVSGILGFGLLKYVESHGIWFQNTVFINMLVAVFLVFTSILLYLSENHNDLLHKPLSAWRAVATGIFQGFAAIPGISRSGATVAGMGLVGIDKERALELSFLLSIPLVLFANIVLNVGTFHALTRDHCIALVSAFVFGMVTIDILLRIVRHVRFSYFVGGFAVLLMILSFMLV